MSQETVRSRGPAIARTKRSFFGGNAADSAFKGVALSFTLVILVVAAAMVIEVVAGSMESIREFGFFRFMASAAWNPVTERFGALHVIVGTLVTSVIAIIIAVPVALGIAVFLSEMAPHWLRGPVSFLVDILAAIPSIVYGLWGIFVLVPLVRSPVGSFLTERLGWIPLFRGPSFGVSSLAAGLVLAIMIVPIISAVVREVIYQVPRAQREGFLALGATKGEVIWKIVLPYAKTGIVGAVILGLGRALGETMAVTMVIGNSHKLTSSILVPNSTMASLIANEFAEATSSLHVSALANVGLVLMIVALVVNALARLLVVLVGRSPTGEVRH